MGVRVQPYLPTLGWLLYNVCPPPPSRHGTHHHRCRVLLCVPPFCVSPHPQWHQVVLALGDYLSVQCHACIGGTSVGEDMRKLDHGQHIVSGTPGRVRHSPTHPPIPTTNPLAYPFTHPLT